MKNRLKEYLAPGWDAEELPTRLDKAWRAAQENGFKGEITSHDGNPQYAPGGFLEEVILALADECNISPEEAWDSLLGACLKAFLAEREEP